MVILHRGTAWEAKLQREGRGSEFADNLQPPLLTPHTEADQIRCLPSIKAGGEAFGSQRRPFSFKARSRTMLSPSSCLVVALLSSLEVETAISATSTWSKSNLRNPNWPSVTLTTCTARTSLDVQQPPFAFVHPPLLQTVNIQRVKQSCLSASQTIPQVCFQHQEHYNSPRGGAGGTPVAMEWFRPAFLLTHVDACSCPTP